MAGVHKMDGCRECKGKLEIIGTSGYGDEVEVHCLSCGEVYNVEPDGLGMAGEEWVIAKIMDMDNQEVLL